MMQPAGIQNPAATTGGLVQDSSLLFAAIMTANACNYVFHALASRFLGPQQYGALVSMLALVTLFSIPSQAIQITVARIAAQEALHERYGRLAAFARRVFKHVLVLGLLFGLVMGSLRNFWAGFFHMPSGDPLLAVGFTIIIMLTLPVVRGLLQGLQRFSSLGINFLADGLLRLGAGWLGFLLAGGVSAGVLAAGLSGTAAVLIGSLPLIGVLKSAPGAGERIRFRQLYGQGITALAAFGSLAALASVDVVLVKHFFKPEAAGFYSAGSIVGKAFLFLPLAMAQALFPKISVGHALAEDTLQTLHQALLLTALALGLAAAAVFLLDRVIILTLFGRAFLNPETIRLVHWFGPAIAPLALVYILVHYHMAVQSTWFAWMMVADIGLLAGAIVLWHAHLLQVLMVLGGNHLLLLAAGYFLTLGGNRARTPRTA